MTTAPLPLTVTERSQMRVLSADGPEAAWQLARRHRAPLVAGATGVQPVWERQARWPACVVPLSADWPGFAGVTVTGDRLDIGALTPLASLAGAPALARRLPSLAPFMDRVASPGVRQLATLGGNLVAGGDLSALALVLEAELRVFSGAGWHHLPLSAWPGWVCREPGALIRSVHLSIPRGCRWFWRNWATGNASARPGSPWPVPGWAPMFAWPSVAKAGRSVWRRWRPAWPGPAARRRRLTANRPWPSWIGATPACAPPVAA